MKKKGAEDNTEFITDISTNSSHSEPSDRISIAMESVSPNQHQSPNHHHSGTNQMLPVHSSSQLEVILHVHLESESNVCSINPFESIITRLRSGAIQRKYYAAMIASFPELKSLQLNEEDLIY